MIKTETENLQVLNPDAPINFEFSFSDNLKVKNAKVVSRTANSTGTIDAEYDPVKGCFFASGKFSDSELPGELSISFDEVVLPKKLEPVPPFGSEQFKQFVNRTLNKMPGEFKNADVQILKPEVSSMSFDEKIPEVSVSPKLRRSFPEGFNPKINSKIEITELTDFNPYEHERSAYIQGDWYAYDFSMVLNQTGANNWQMKISMIVPGQVVDELNKSNDKTVGIQSSHAFLFDLVFGGTLDGIMGIWSLYDIFKSTGEFYDAQGKCWRIKMAAMFCNEPSRSYYQRKAAELEKDKLIALLAGCLVELIGTGLSLTGAGLSVSIPLFIIGKILDSVTGNRWEHSCKENK
ncbi:MAG: hypothetical protein N2645_21420 [Clostridia bacterium]|nr:hypothetical protein [Clostridia bacterium]